MSELLSQDHIANDKLQVSPRLRLNRSAALTLSTAWQVIDFNGTSGFNVNTFPMMDSGVTSVAWDATNKKLTFNQPDDRNYDITFYYNLTATLTGVDVHFRFVVPAPTPIYFPFPDGRGYKNLATTQSFTDFGDEYNTTIYANSSIRQYGLQMQIRQATTLLNMPVLANATAVIYGR